MAVTTNYGWTKPTVGGSAETWGTENNAVIDAIDAQVKTVADAVVSEAALARDASNLSSGTIPAARIAPIALTKLDSGGATNGQALVWNSTSMAWEPGTVSGGGGGGDALTTNPLSQFASTTSAQLKTVISDETGSGALVFATSPTLTTPALGTPSAAVLTNATGLPIASGVSGLGSNVATFLATPSSANLAAAVTGETGSGALVFNDSPTLITPILGTPASGNATNLTNIPVNQGIGNLAVARLNSGSGASSSTFWRGDGTWAAPAGVSAERASLESTTTHPVLTSTVLALSWDNELYDPSNLHSNSVNNTRVTVATTGVYLITGRITYGSDIGSQRAAMIYINGVKQAQVVIPNTSGFAPTIEINAQMALSASDYIELVAFQDSGSTVSTVAGSKFTGLSIVRLA